MAMADSSGDVDAARRERLRWLRAQGGRLMSEGVVDTDDGAMATAGLAGPNKRVEYEGVGRRLQNRGEEEALGKEGELGGVEADGG